MTGNSDSRNQFCRACGAQVGVEHEFCGKCGQPVHEATSAASGRGRWRWAAVVGVLMLAAIATVGTAILINGRDFQESTPFCGGSASASADPTYTSTGRALDAFDSTESARRLLITAPGWEVTDARFDEDTDHPGIVFGEIRFRDEERRLDLHWRRAETFHPSKLADIVVMGTATNT